jgi:hypothetical protein
MFQTKVVEKRKTHILCSITFFENCAIYEIMWKNNVELGRKLMTIWCMSFACWIHTQNMSYLLLFHCNNGCMNVPQCHVIHKLPCLFSFYTLNGIILEEYQWLVQISCDISDTYIHRISANLRFSFSSHYNMKWQRKKDWPKFLNWHPHSKNSVMLWFINGACSIYTCLVWYRNTPALCMGITVDAHLTCRARFGVCVVCEIARKSILEPREHRL